jgi:GT2 family glycosyltransferase
MKAFVIIATKGRPQETARLLDYLAVQTAPPAQIYVCGAGPADIEPAARHSLAAAGIVKTSISVHTGLTRQRNAAVRQMLADGADDGFAAFFDDDFVPAANWLADCGEYFSTMPDVAALTGQVLADGVRREAYSYDDADAYISGARPAEEHWATGEAIRDVHSVYGCNMAVRLSALRSCSFDERLPLYGWQEDRDFTGQVRKHGHTIYAPRCRGVHLGVKGGRISGVRFGYSQIANPIYLLGKGTTSPRAASWLVGRALAANVIKTAVRRTKLFDYPGRLRGNALALMDLVRGRCAPERILDL